MGGKIALTGMLFAWLLLVPAVVSVVNEREVPGWFKVAIIVPGGLGVVAMLIGVLVAIWG